MDRNTKENGRTINFTDSEYTNGLTEIDMKDSFNTGRSMDKANLNGLKENTMMVIGMSIIHMEVEGE